MESGGQLWFSLRKEGWKGGEGTNSDLRERRDDLEVVRCWSRGNLVSLLDVVLRNRVSEGDSGKGEEG